jgi:hypothetical protein
MLSIQASAPQFGVDRMQRNSEPMRRQVEEWRSRQISTVAAKLIIYQAFVESELDAPKHLARQVHDLYFRPTHPEFEPRTLWSLTNAFTSAFKELDPIPQFKATAEPSGFLQGVRIQIAGLRQEPRHTPRDMNGERWAATRG